MVTPTDAMANSPYTDALLRLLGRRKVFVSYHHHGDRGSYDSLSSVISSEYDVIQDNSVEREIDSDDSDYVIRRIREDYITGTSCTLVLCGADTCDRKFVDWEIKATLDAHHGLIGIALPTARLSADGCVVVPARLHDNIVSGFGVWTDWEQLFSGPLALKTVIEMATARRSSLIDNSRPLRRRNG